MQGEGTLVRSARLPFGTDDQSRDNLESFQNFQGGIKLVSSLTAICCGHEAVLHTRAPQAGQGSELAAATLRSAAKGNGEGVAVPASTAAAQSWSGLRAQGILDARMPVPH